MTVRRETPLDAARIVQVLAEHGVDYVMIGGLAVQAHGHVRTTQDADVLPAASAANAAHLLSALHALNARPLDPALGSRRLNAALLRAHDTLALDSDAGGLDIHRSPPGAAPYRELRRRALVVEVFGVEVAFAGRDDLIAMKRTAGRPLDRGDIAALTEEE